MDSVLLALSWADFLGFIETYFWLFIFVAMLVVEGITLGLTTIWFAGGALIAFILALFKISIPLQIMVFIVVSVGLLFSTRPLAKKYINSKKFKSNYEGIIGKVAKITEKVDNYNSTGVAAVNGQEWTARSTDDAVVIEAGTLAKIVSIDGVKLIVEQYNGD